VKNVFPATNPSFGDITITNQYTTFDIEEAAADNIIVSISNLDLTVTLSERWLWFVKNNICDAGTFVSLDE